MPSPWQRTTLEVHWVSHHDIRSQTLGQVHVEPTNWQWRKALKLIEDNQHKTSLI